VAEIAAQAAGGASTLEIAAYHEVPVEWLRKEFGRYLAKARAKRNIALRGALTRLALGGNLQALKRISELEARRQNELKKQEERERDDK
jgi:hypothetical protein